MVSKKCVATAVVMMATSAVAVERNIASWNVKSYPDPYPILSGDTIKFESNSSHDLHTSADCNTDNLATSTWPYTTAAITADVEYQCHKLQHCQSGQVLKVKIADKLSSFASTDNVQVARGDLFGLITAEGEWATADLAVFASAEKYTACDFTGATTIGSNGGAIYTIPATGSAFYLGDKATGKCAAGAKVCLYVDAAGDCADRAAESDASTLSISAVASVVVAATAFTLV